MPEEIPRQRVKDLALTLGEHPYLLGIRPESQGIVV